MFSTWILRYGALTGAILYLVSPTQSRLVEEALDCARRRSASDVEVGKSWMSGEDARWETGGGESKSRRQEIGSQWNDCWVTGSRRIVSLLSSGEIQMNARAKPATYLSWKIES